MQTTTTDIAIRIIVVIGGSIVGSKDSWNLQQGPKKAAAGEVAHKNPLSGDSPFLPPANNDDTNSSLNNSSLNNSFHSNMNLEVLYNVNYTKIHY